MKDPDPLNVRPDDPLVKWRREAIRGEEARRAAKRELRQICDGHHRQRLNTCYACKVT
jgi:hypothetical protein